VASRLDQVYRHLPVPLQHAAVTAFGLKWRWQRLGGSFERERLGYIERERWTRPEWRAYQTATLRHLLRLAVERVPYYQRAYRGVLTPAQADRFELGDLPSLPVLEKDAPRAAPEDFLLDGKPPEGATICPTSGSSGTPVRTYWTNDDFRRSIALRAARSCRPAGVSFRDPRATFSGRIVVPDPRSRGPFYRFNLAERQVYFSAFHISPANLPGYIEPLERHGIVWGTGYTHAWEQLARMMLEQGVPRPSKLRAIITTSEKLFPEGRRLIEKAFGCTVVQEYGTVEDCLYACEHADGRLRVSPDAGVIELLDPAGRPIGEDDGREGAVVCTGFVRRSQLFLRYRLGDVAAWDTEPDTTGFSMPILREVVGRIEDVVEAPDGRRTVRFHGVFTEVPGVREAQVIQEARDHIRILVVAARDYGPASTREIIQRVHQRLTADVRCDVEVVESIPRTKAGKLQAVVSKIARA
jgi:phenylacetate-CoA ligase